MPTAVPKLELTTELTSAIKVLSPAVKRFTKALKTLDPAKVPVGALADLLYDLRQVSRTLSTLTAPFEDVVNPTIKLIEEHFVQTLSVDESSGVQGHKSRVQVTASVVPVVEDWEKFYAHIAKTKQFELLNRAANRSSIVERWDAKKQVPGIGKFTAKKVSCTKLSGK